MMRQKPAMMKNMSGAKVISKRPAQSNVKGSGAATSSREGYPHMSWKNITGAWTKYKKGQS